VSRRKELSKTDDEEHGPRRASTFIGGWRIRGLNASRPLIRLTILSDRIQLQLSVPWLRHFIPKREFLLLEIAEVRAIGVSNWCGGIRIRGTQYDDWAIFWAWNRESTLSAIERAGAPVVRAVASFSPFHPNKDWYND
jgi:hypothetical protein